LFVVVHYRQRVQQSRQPLRMALINVRRSFWLRALSALASRQQPFHKTFLRCVLIKILIRLPLLGARVIKVENKLHEISISL